MVSENITWSPGITLDDIEKQVILKAFRFYRGNKTTTAQALGVSVRTIDNKLERYQLEDSEKEKSDEQRRLDRENFLARQRGIVTINAETGSSVLGSASGARVEPTSEDSAQQTMPLPKRAQVQTVLPGPIAKSGAGKHR
jgi:hypothetical protein